MSNLFKYGNSRYEIKLGKKSFEDARLDCISGKGKLLEINSEKENGFIHMWLEFYLKNGTITEEGLKFFIGGFIK